MKPGYFICDGCGGVFPVDDARKSTEDVLRYCEGCFFERHTQCDDCGAECAIDFAESTRDGRTICPACFDRYYCRCRDCGEVVAIADAVLVGDAEYLICLQCYENGYFTCADCGRVRPADMHEGEGFCTTCSSAAASWAGLHPYAYHPVPIFHESIGRRDSVYFGVELEYSLAHRTEIPFYLSTAHDILNPAGGEENFYFKAESGITNGVELVSHPRTLESWYDFPRQQIAGYFALAQRYALPVDEVCGLHIHVSRKGMSPGHKLRFGVFFHAFRHELYPVARRYSSTYAKYKPIPRNGSGRDALLAGASSSRYEAANWGPPDTVEVRIFKSTLDPDEFLACIELCHAVYYFTKSCTSICRILSGGAWGDFLRWIEHGYNHLNALVREEP